MAHGGGWGQVARRKHTRVVLFLVALLARLSDDGRERKCVAWLPSVRGGRRRWIDKVGSVVETACDRDELLCAAACHNVQWSRTPDEDLCVVCAAASRLL